MIRLILLLSILIFSTHINACSVPYNGPEYDALIKVSRTELENRFSLELPAKINNSNTALIYLAYAKLPLDNSFLAEFMVEIKLKKGSDLLSGQFDAKEREGYTPYLHVVWPGAGCSTNANIMLSDFE